MNSLTVTELSKYTRVQLVAMFELLAANVTAIKQEYQVIAAENLYTIAMVYKERIIAANNKGSMPVSMFRRNVETNALMFAEIDSIRQSI